MAMTQKFHVSFDATATLSTEDTIAMEQDVINLCKAIGKGTIEPSPVQKEMVVQFLSHGMEGAMRFVVREALRKIVKDACHDNLDEKDFKFSPATVTEVK